MVAEVPRPIPRPSSQAPPPCSGPCTPGRKSLVTEVASPQAQAVGGTDKEPGIHPNARHPSKCPHSSQAKRPSSQARSPGCALWPPGVRPGSVGPRRSGWSPGRPVLWLQLLLNSGDLRTLGWASMAPAVPQPKARSGVPGLRLRATFWSAEGPRLPAGGGRPGPGAGPYSHSSRVQTQAPGGRHSKNW